MDGQEIIRIRWHVDRTAEPAVYMLVSETPGHEDLKVSVSSGEMTERVAKAKLMQAMYELGKEKGIAPQRLRFKINGIEECNRNITESCPRTEAAFIMHGNYFTISSRMDSTMNTAAAIFVPRASLASSVLALALLK